MQILLLRAQSILVHDGRVKKSPVKVVFENCVFEGGWRSSLFVGEAGQVQLLDSNEGSDCLNEGSGISVYNGGSAAAHHCSFTNMREGFNLSGKLSKAEVMNCTFNQTFDSIHVESGANVRVEGCQFVDSGTSFRLVGPQRSTAFIRRCLAVNCGIGIHVSYGKMDLTVVNCQFRCKKTGVYVKCDVVGHIDLVDCALTGETQSFQKYQIWSARRCLITIDGESQIPKTNEAIRASAKKQMQTEEVTLYQRRRYKMAGVGDVKCFNCSKVEPKRPLFRKCARCKEACYCSKECQVGHWRNHREVCDNAVEGAFQDEEEDAAEDEGDVMELLKEMAQKMPSTA